MKQGIIKKTLRLLSQERIQTAIFTLVGLIAGAGLSLWAGLNVSVLASIGGAFGAALSVGLSIIREIDAPAEDSKRALRELIARGRDATKPLDMLCLSAHNMDHFYQVGQISPDYETFVSHVLVKPGGSGANTAYALAKLGRKVAIIGVVGTDELGSDLRNDLTISGVETSFLLSSDLKPSGKTIILTTGPHRTIIVEPGVNDTLHKNINIILAGVRDSAKKAKVLHLTSFAGEEERRLQLQLMSFTDSKTLISFTPGTIQSEQGIEELKQILFRINLLFIYENDLRRMMKPELGSSAESMGLKQVVSHLYDWRMKRLSKEPLMLVIKNRANLSGDVSPYFSVFYGVHAPKGPYNTSGLPRNGESAKILDTTGAGDACAAGVIYALLASDEIQEDVSTIRKYAHRMAIMASTHIGARDGLPTEEKLASLLRQRPS